MFDVIGAQLPCWVAGPGVGLCVVAVYGLINARLGVSGAWLATILPVAAGQPRRPGRLTTMASWLLRAMTTTASASVGFSSRCGVTGGTNT